MGVNGLEVWGGGPWAAEMPPQPLQGMDSNAGCGGRRSADVELREHSDMVGFLQETKLWVLLGVV